MHLSPTFILPCLLSKRQLSNGTFGTEASQRCRYILLWLRCPLEQFTHRHFHAARAVARQLWLPSRVKHSSKDSSQGCNGRHRGSICTKTVLRITSLAAPSVVDFVSQDNNSLITFRYLKHLHRLIFVLIARAVLWTPRNTALAARAAVAVFTCTRCQWLASSQQPALMGYCPCTWTLSANI